MSFTINAAILAAGEGKRLKLSTSKPLANLCGQCLIDFPIQEFTTFIQKISAHGRIGMVVGHQKEALTEYLTTKYKDNTVPLDYMVQEKQLGTADALRSYFKGIKEEGDYTLILCADTPLIRSTDLEQLFQHMQTSPHLQGIVATFQLDNPKGYGRIVRRGQGLHIVEEKDATPSDQQITEVNSGLYIFKTSFIKEQLQKVQNNNQSGEFYLTDVFQDHLPVSAHLFPNGEKFAGVNDLLQLEWVERKLRQEKIDRLREMGVRFLDSSQTYLDWNVEIGEKTVIYPNAHIEGNTTIADHVTIETGAIIKNCKIGTSVKIKPYSYLENSQVECQASIGPFAHLRPGSHIGPESKIGNFVEIKKATLAQGVKVSHLSYIGDAVIGEECNIGCGFITCNYDGIQKHQTTIGKGTFIGSDCQAVAPITIGDNCFVAAGSTLTENMPNEAFAIARSKQMTKEMMAKRFLKKKK